MPNIPDFTPQETQALDKWASNIQDLDPNNAFDAMGFSPGFAGYKTHEELKPGFWDEALAGAGILTDKMRERQELAGKQQELMPFVKSMIAEKLALRRVLAASPEMSDQVHPAVAGMLGLDRAQGNAGPIGTTPTALQPAPNQQPAFGSDQQPMMLRPAPSLGDQVMAGMPLGTPGQMGALSEVQPFAAPMQPGSEPLPFAPLEQTGMQNVPEYDPTTGGMRPGLQSVAIRNGPPMLTETVRDQPITMADRKQFPQPAPVQPPRQLSIPERFQVADAMKAQAAGHLMVDETGKLVPSSFLLPDAKALTGEQQESLRRVMNGEPPLPGVLLPAAQYTAALKGRTEARVGSMPEIVKLQNQADQLPEGSPRRAQLEDRIRRLTTESKADIGEVAAAQAEFAALPPELQTSQNAALIAKRHKDVPTEDIMKGAKNPNQPLVNINTGVSASEEAAKQFMASTRTTFDQLKSAPTAIRNIEEAKKLIPAAKGFMGPGGEGLLSAAKFLNSRLGTKIDTAGVKSAEELRTRIFFNILDNLKKLDAQPSQLQQQIMMDSLGKLGTDPNALANVLDAFSDTIRGKVEQHNSEVESASGRNVKFPYNPIIKLPPRAAKQEAAPAGPARIQSDDDYNKLPSGATFIAPDGTTRRKP